MLKVTNLRKEYDNVVAIDGVSLDVRRGELFGLLGPNGAGKTTTIRTVLDIIQPDGGTITFDGKPFTHELWNTIGFLPEERGLYRKSKIMNTILYFASLKGLSPKEAKPRAWYWLERFGLKQDGHRKIEELSKGNQQKVQLIISILHRPQLLILDEPFSGLDPINQILLKEILMELRQQNVAIIFSTHQMEQVEKMCDSICLINKGKPVLQGPLHEVKKRYGSNSIHLEFEGDGSFLKKFEFVRRADVYQNYAELELTDITRSSELLGPLSENLSLRKFEIVEPSLNSIFITVVGGPDKIEPADAKKAPESIRMDRPGGVMKDPRVRKTLFSLGAAVLLTLVFTLASLRDAELSWYLPAAFLGASIFSVFRFLQVKKKVEKELGARPKEREHV